MSVPFGLLPRTAALGPGGLAIGGCDLADLADRHGTPLIVYDERHLRDVCGQLAAAFPDGVSYAGKAFLCLAMAQLVHQEGLSIDVASGGELATALAAGVPGERLILHGNNKSEAELRAALRARVGRVVLDSEDEIARLTAAVETDAHPPPEVLIRLNPGVDVPTHAHISTGHAESKFGFRVDTGLAARVLRSVADDSRLALAGVHVHVGSQLHDLSAVAGGVRLAARLAVRHGLGEVSVGGGLGVNHTAADRAPTINDWAQAVREAAGSAGYTGRLVAEPGRSLAGPAAVTLYRVGTVKHVGRRTFVSVDGGLSDNPRPALYGSRYEALLVDDPRIGGEPQGGEPDRRPDGARVSVVGKNCESGDILVHHARFPRDVRVGDLLCVPVTGAYVHAMSSNYNKLPRPAVVFVRDRRSYPVIRRETAEDLLRADIPLAALGDGPALAASSAPAAR